MTTQRIVLVVLVLFASLFSGCRSADTIGFVSNGQLIEVKKASEPVEKDLFSFKIFGEEFKIFTKGQQVYIKKRLDDFGPWRAGSECRMALGEFLRVNYRELQLKPGNYSVSGVRQGYIRNNNWEAYNITNATVNGFSVVKTIAGRYKKKSK